MNYQTILGQHILTEKSIKGIKCQAGAFRHGQFENGHTKLPGQGRRDRRFEKPPQMTAIAGPGPLQADGDGLFLADASDQLGVRLPVGFVKIHCQKETGIRLGQRV